MVSAIPSGFSFPKSSRLLNSSEYQRIFSKADYKISHQNLLILARDNHLPWARLGLVVAKKNIPRAVRRNRIKRHARETFRQQRPNLPAIDAIVLARRNLDALSNPELRELLLRQWARLRQQIQKQKST